MFWKQTYLKLDVFMFVSSFVYRHYECCNVDVSVEFGKPILFYTVTDKKKIRNPYDYSTVCCWSLFNMVPRDYGGHRIEPRLGHWPFV
jgi:hypothetical protein